MEENGAPRIGSAKKDQAAAIDRRKKSEVLRIDDIRRKLRGSDANCRDTEVEQAQFHAGLGEESNVPQTSEAHRKLKERIGTTTWKGSLLSLGASDGMSDNGSVFEHEETLNYASSSLRRSGSIGSSVAGSRHSTKPSSPAEMSTPGGSTMLPVKLKTSKTLTGTGNAAKIKSVGFSAGGSVLAMGDANGLITLWDTTDMSLMREIRGHTAAVWSLMFTTGGSILVSASWDHTARIWETRSGKQLQLLSGHTDHVWAACFSSSGQVVVTGSADETVRLWATSTGEPIDFFSASLVHPVIGVAISADDKVLAECSFDSTCRIWNLGEGTRTFAVLQEIKEEAERIKRSQFDNRASQTSLRDDQQKRKADRRSFFGVDEEVVTPNEDKPHQNMTPMGSCSPQHVLRGHTAAVVSNFLGCVRLGYSIVPKHRLIIVPISSILMSSLMFHPQGHMLITGSHDKTACLWNPKSGELLRRIKSDSEHPVWSSVFSLDGSLFALGTGAGTVELWDSSDYTMLHKFQAHQNSYVDSCVFSSDGLRLATGSDSSEVAIWQVLTTSELRSYRDKELKMWRRRRTASVTENYERKRSENSFLEPRSHQYSTADLGSTGEKQHGGSIEIGIQEIDALTELRQADLRRELAAIAALREATDKMQVKADAASAKKLRDEAARLRRDELGLPTWGLLPDGSDFQYLADLQARRQVLYDKLGRADIGNTRTYLGVNELHPGDLEQQAKMERILHGRSLFVAAKTSGLTV